LLRAPVPTGTQTRQTGPEAGEGDRSSATKSYLLAGVIVLAISAAIYLLTVPDQGPAGLQHGAMQPPQQQQGENLPPGHPPTNQGPTPEQQRMISELRGKLAANPNDEEAKLQLANALYDANQHEEALPLYRDYVKNHPENEDARTDMAYSMYQTGDLEGAIAELRTITSQAGKHQNAAYNLAMMYVVKRNRDSVQYWMERVIEIDSTTTQAKNAREIMQALSEAHPGETVPPAGN
jgi:thioredoxin-like negative regulator of GroEL